MSSIAWSNKGEKTTPGVAADEIMIIDSEDITPATTNKRMAYQNLADSLLDLTSVAGLNDGEATRLSSAIVIFEDVGGAKFRGSIQPNPTRQINILNQPQLEAELGTDLEIPDGVAITISLNDDLTLTKPFKIGLGSSLEVVGATLVTTLTYTGPGALFQNENVANPIRSVLVRDILLRGDGDGSPANGTNSIFDIIGTAFLICDDTQMSDFGSIGIADLPVYRFTGFSPTNVNTGLVVKNPVIFTVSASLVTQFTDTGFTFFSFIMGVVGELRFDAIVPLNVFSGSALTYVPPTTPTGSQITVNRSVAGAGKIFQQGSDNVIPLVLDDGGSPNFVTNFVHNFVVGEVVTISGFVTETTYNGTFIVTAIPQTTEFIIGELAFTNSDAGSVTAASLDGTDVRVLSQANAGEPDSMFVGETGLDIFGAEDVTSSLAQDAFEVFTNVGWISANLERFIEGVADTGQLICKDPGIKKYAIAYSGSLEKSGGGSLNAGVVILKNGVNVTFNAPHTTLTGIVQIGGTDIVELTDGDTLDIALINYDGSPTAFSVSQLSLLVARA